MAPIFKVIQADCGLAAAGSWLTLRVRGFLVRAFRVVVAATLFDLLAPAQCTQHVDAPNTAATCIEHSLPAEPKAELDEQHPYSLDELVDVAERNNPRTRVAWERARQAAEKLHLSRSAYYPELTLLASFGDERTIVPFPKPIAPRGYIMAEVPILAPAVRLEYTLFDSSGRASVVAAAASNRLAAAAAFERVNQDVALSVIHDYYGLVTAEQRLAAARQILATARTTEDAAQAQLENGRATMPDLLNARAARAQAAFDLEDAVGASRTARVSLRESLGVEPSDQIQIASPLDAPQLEEVTESIEALISTALSDRPDLLQLSEQVRAAAANIRTAEADQRPSLQLEGKVSQTAAWPSADYGELGSADQTTWSAGISFHWSLFDGGRRSREVALARSEERQQQDELAEQHDHVSREVWTAYVAFGTAVRQSEAADALLQSAEESYDASLEAYRFGVKNLIDVVTAEQQLAKARLARVQATSAVWLSAAQLEYATGDLLRGHPSLTSPLPNQRAPQP